MRLTNIKVIVRMAMWRRLWHLLASAGWLRQWDFTLVCALTTCTHCTLYAYTQADLADQRRAPLRKRRNPFNHQSRAPNAALAPQLSKHERQRYCPYLYHDVGTTEGGYEDDNQHQHDSA